jgi:hypothetical protein
MCSINPTPAGIKNIGIIFKIGEAEGLIWCSFTTPNSNKLSKITMPRSGAGKLPPIKCIINLAHPKHSKIIALLSKYFMIMAH